MEFDKIVAIDWSGAKRTNKKIQVAEYRPDKDNVKLVSPRQGVNWTRGKVWERYFGERCNERILIGIDFAFAYPFCDKRAYFPGHNETPRDATLLWAKVEEICAGESDFYAGPFYLTENAKFSGYLLFRRYTESMYEERFRKTEDKCKQAGFTPSDVFKCVGPSVGVGSIAGFRFLHKIKTKSAARIWPFCGKPTSIGTTVVEIYPALFTKPAGVYSNRNPETKQLMHALKCYKVDLAPELISRKSFTDDERDALVSAAGMKRWLDCKGKSAWEAAERSHAMYEGWIFGI